MPASRDRWRGTTLTAPPPVSLHGSFPCPTGGTGALHGQFRLQRPVQTTRRLTVIGYIGGALVDGSGRTMGYASRRVALPLPTASARGSLRDVLEGMEVSLAGLPVVLHVPAPRSMPCS